MSDNQANKSVKVSKKVQQNEKGFLYFLGYLKVKFIDTMVDSIKKDWQGIKNWKVPTFFKVLYWIFRFTVLLSCISFIALPVYGIYWGSLYIYGINLYYFLASPIVLMIILGGVFMTYLNRTGRVKK